MKKSFLTVVAFGLLSSFSHARFARPTEAPIERIVKNLHESIKKSPKDDKIYYTLARVHYLAFANELHSLNYYQYGEKPLTLAPWQNLNQAVKGKLVPKDAVDHFNKSLLFFTSAIDIEPSNGLYTLGLASLHDQYSSADWQKKLGSVKTKAKPLADKAINDLYYKAFTQAKEKDSKVSHVPIRGLKSLVTYEAGKAFLKRAPKDKRAAEVTAHLDKLNALRRGPITPVIVDLTGKHSSIEKVINAKASVKFDLIGMDAPFHYSWPTASTGFLVWDPQNLGKITTGKQLFGNYTWGIFWENGYEALQILDDNADGKLAGKELKNLSIWQDLNGNGISEAGEVKPLAKHQITTIHTHFQDKDGIHPRHAQGMDTASGKKLTTWDWIAFPKK